jgi:hypothetical protein
MLIIKGITIKNDSVLNECKFFKNQHFKKALMCNVTTTKLSLYTIYINKGALMKIK